MTKNNQIRFKNSILISILCNICLQRCIYTFSWNYIIRNTAAQVQANNVVNKKVICKNGAPFIKYISRIKYSQVDHDYDIDVIMLIYNLTEYKNNYSKISGISWQY